MDEKATQRTIPGLVALHKPFANTSGTLRGIENPEPVTEFGTLAEDEISRLRIDQDTVGIAYLIVSYKTPIAWVTKTGWTYKVHQALTQTSQKHMALLYLMYEGRETPGP